MHVCDSVLIEHRSSFRKRIMDFPVGTAVPMEKHRRMAVRASGTAATATWDMLSWE